MADLLLLGLFGNVETTADVIDDVRALGIPERDIDVMSNIPLSASFFNRKAARMWFLPFVLGGALVGVLLATFLTFGTTSIYPIHVGGQDLTALPPTAIMYFELIALFSMLGGFVGFLVQNRFPLMTRETLYDERITEGYIGVHVRAAGDVANSVKEVFEDHHAYALHMEDSANFTPQGIRHLLFWGGVGTAGLVALAVPLLLSYDIVDVPWVNRMADTVAVQPQEGPRRAAPAEAIPVSGPVLIAGEPATRPLEASATSLQRGEMLFEVNCVLCHGRDAEKSGATIAPYLAEAPAMQTERVQGLSPDHIFVVITNGRNRMPSLAENLTPGETWDIVNYIHSLSAESGDAGQ